MNNILDLINYSIVFLDKPYGITSHKASEIVKKELQKNFGVKIKVGHTGTLDPKVTGMLILLIGKSTRLMRLFNLDKTYIAVAKLHKEIDNRSITQTINEKFTGIIKQLPPKRSAVKRAIRQRVVYEFSLMERKDRILLFKIRCQAGTYVRKLIHDLGNALGVGMHMLELRRIAVGNFNERLCVNLYDVIQAIRNKKTNVFVSIEKVVDKLRLPKLQLSKEKAKKFCMGQFLKLEVKNITDRIMLVFYNKKLIGYGKIINTKLKPEAVIRQVQ